MTTKTHLGQIACAFMVALLLGFVGSINAQDTTLDFDQYGRWTNGITETWTFRSNAYSQAEADRARRKWVALAVENERAVNEWAGDYRGGELHGSFLRWSETGFVLMSVFTCEANVTDVEYGTVATSRRLIQLTAERLREKRSHAKGSPKHGGHVFSSMRLVPIKWGPDRYLVPESQLATFADYLAGLGNSSGSGVSLEQHDYLWNSTGDEVDLFTTPPVFPSGYEKFLRLPIVGKITAVSRSSVRLDPQNEWWSKLIIPVTINVGRKQGVRPGIAFYLVDQEEQETLEITRVGLHSSKGVITRSVRKKPGIKVNEWDDGEPLKSEPIEIGMRLTSSQHQALRVRKTN